MISLKSFSSVGFSQLQLLYDAGYTVAESDYAGIVSSVSTLHSKSLAYEFTRVSSDTFDYRVYRLDPKDTMPANTDLYHLARTESGAKLGGPTNSRQVTICETCQPTSGNGSE